MDKIFDYTREELIEMFTPLYEFEEKVNDITTEKTGCGFVISTPDYNKNICLWLQNRINNSRLSKADKEYICDTISGFINNFFVAGKVEMLKELGLTDTYAQSEAERRINKHKECFDKLNHRED